MESIYSFFSTERRKAFFPFAIVEVSKALFGINLYNRIDNKIADNLFLFSNVIFLILHYTLDIFIAKDLPSTHKRYSFFKKSFLNSIFFKYVIVFTISFITSESIVEYIDRIFKHNNFKFHKNEDYNKIILRTIVNVIMNILIYHYIKFKWALSDQKFPITDIIIMCWVSLLILLYMIFKSINNLEKNCKNV